MYEAVIGAHVQVLPAALDALYVDPSLVSHQEVPLHGGDQLEGFHAHAELRHLLQGLRDKKHTLLKTLNLITFEALTQRFLLPHGLLFLFNLFYSMQGKEDYFRSEECRSITFKFKNALLMCFLVISQKCISFQCIHQMYYPFDSIISTQNSSRAHIAF